MRILILVCIALEFFLFESCKKDIGSAVNSASSEVDGPTVYVAGDTNYMNSNPIAVYWKNGVRHALSTSFRGSEAKSIFVVGNDVYVAGDTTSPLGQSVAVYWKNGTLISLSKASVANSIYVSGSDVYVAGYTTDVNTVSYATYWKNGNPIVIGTRHSAAN